MVWDGDESEGERQLLNAHSESADREVYVHDGLLTHRNSRERARDKIPSFSPFQSGVLVSHRADNGEEGKLDQR